MSGKHAAPDVQVLPYESSRYEAYATFAETAYGRGCYQASRGYLEWLYGVERSPAPRRDDFLVAVAGDRVVGCLHKMRLLWRSGGELLEVPALHNWIVDEEFRSGVGLVLLMKALRSERHAYISSAAGDLASVYHKLKCQDVRANVYRKVLRPVAGAARLGLHRLTKRESTMRRVRSRIRRSTSAAAARDLEIVHEPSDGDLERMIGTLVVSAGERTHPHWSVASFRWRFFHPSGPRHLCVRMPGARAGRDDFVIVAIGARRGLVIARIIELDLASPERSHAFLDGAVRLLKGIGVHVVLGYSAHPTINSRLQDAGWPPVGDGQASFFYHGPRELPFAALAFNSSAADFGFESMRR